MISKYSWRKPSRGCGTSVKAMLLLAVVFLLGCDSPTQLRIGSGSTTNYFGKVGRALERMLEEEKHAAIGKVTNLYSGGSKENVEGLLKPANDPGKMELGLSALITYTLLDRQKGSKIVLPLFDFYMHLVVSNSLGVKCSDFKKDFVALKQCLKYNGDGEGDRPSLIVNVGKPGSGLRFKATRVLAELIESDDSVESLIDSHNRIDLFGDSEELKLIGNWPSSSDGGQSSEVAKQLKWGDVHAVFVSAPIPDQRIEKLLAAGHFLYEIDPKTFEDEQLLAKKIEGEIPAFTYHGQTIAVPTVKDPSMLLADETLPAETIMAVLRTIFEKASYLRDAHPSTSSIWTYFNKRERRKFAEAEDFHPGVERFFDDIEDDILIASGPVEGIHYQRAKDLQGILTRYEISSFVVPTRGSIENLLYLGTDNRPVVAIVDYHAALASYLPDSSSVFSSMQPHDSMLIPEDQQPIVYDEDQGSEVLRSSIAGGTREAADEPVIFDLWGIPKKIPFTRLGNLYSQVLLPIVRKNYPLDELDCCFTSAEPNSGNATDQIYSGNRLGKLRVSFGDPQSGTQVLSRAVMAKALDSQFNIESAEFLSTGSTSRRLWGGSLTDGQEGQIDVAFLVSHQNSGMVNQLLRNKTVKPIGLSGHLIRNFISSPAIQRRSLELPDVGVINTLETKAILVVNSSVTDEEAETITRAVHENSSQFVEQTSGINESVSIDKHLVDFSSPIPLHSEAEAYYRNVGILPGDSFSWVDFGGSVARLLVPLLSIMGIFLRPVVRHYGIVRMEKRVANVEIKSGTDDAVFQLRQLEDEAKSSMNRKIWRDTLHGRGLPISTGGWRSLEALISQRIDTARHFLTRNLAWELTESIGHGDAHEATWRKEFSMRIANYFHRGEINIGQYEFLRRLLSGEEAYQPMRNSHTAEVEDASHTDHAQG